MLLKTKKPNPIDKQVGARIRLGRTIRKISQETLGEGLGVSFQQIQKYETGKNRVGAGRLGDIAAILKQPVSWFFEDLPAAPESGADEITALLQSPDGLKLIRSYSQLKSQNYREAVQAVITTLLKQESLDAEKSKERA